MAEQTHIAERSGNAWADFYAQHRAALESWAMSLTGHADDAADLIQDVLLRLIGTQPAARSMKAYVLSAMRRRAVDFHRKRASADARIARTQVISERDPTLPDDESEFLRRAVSDLPPDRREIVVLRTYCDMSFREIAEMLDKPIGTVTSYYARGLEDLRRVITRTQSHV